METSVVFHPRRALAMPLVSRPRVPILRPVGQGCFTQLLWPQRFESGEF